jgi:hypothetical protein
MIWTIRSDGRIDPSCVRWQERSRPSMMHRRSWKRLYTPENVFNAGASLDRKMIATGPKIRLHGRCGQRVPAGVGVAHGRRRATERAGAHREFHPARPPNCSGNRPTVRDPIPRQRTTPVWVLHRAAVVWRFAGAMRASRGAGGSEGTSAGVASRRPGPLELADCHQPACCMFSSAAASCNTCCFGYQRGTTKEKIQCGCCSGPSATFAIGIAGPH